jgi:predicted DCC family thiol-disulfide oxidoreductase YuxK
MDYYSERVAYYLKSEAALEIAKHLSGGIALLSVFKTLPTAFSNSLYDYIAKTDTNGLEERNIV